MSLSHLPPATRALAELIGLPALLALARWRGGVSIHIPWPEHLAADHPLVQCIGLDAARLLAQRYVGERLEVPRVSAHTRAVLHAEIRRRRAAGESEARVALETGFTGRWVRQIVAEGRDDRQGDLFG